MVQIGNVSTFSNIEQSKEQALKVLEEAAEVFGAWQWGSELNVLGECADVIQATCNLIAAYGVEDFTPYLELCKKGNIERGRSYGQSSAR